MPVRENDDVESQQARLIQPEGLANEALEPISLTCLRDRFFRHDNAQSRRIIGF